jgi:pimeloyl-ACP methyl ester carboxylesterase
MFPRFDFPAAAVHLGTMDTQPEPIDRRRLTLTGADGNALCADLYAPRHATEGLVVLAHGGGQTRHSWGGTARTLAARGWNAVAYDQRGHGDSAWVADAAYDSEHYAHDLVAVVRQLADSGYGKPVAVGASLGGMAGLLAAGELDRSALRALVLVDITPGMKPEGRDRILGFMEAHAEEGFASPAEAADAISAYLPHRPRPRSLSGLTKNLRRGDDGRFRWHWDPRFLDARRTAAQHAELEERLEAAARRLTIPVLLVRGRESELVGEAEAEAFRKLVPHAEVADVSGARHMVAGDRNDVFGDAVAAFLARL